jgi:tRNA dimethylallyltransferase
LINFKDNNALQTVGYREIFDYFDNEISLAKAIENIKTNTRHYAKRQMTWFKKDARHQMVFSLQLPLQTFLG